MKKLIKETIYAILTVTIIALMLAILTTYCEACESCANETFECPKEIDFTCYIDRGICYTGCETRQGIAAADEAHIGATALIYTLDGEFLGYYEVLDKIGTEWGRNGNCIDVWCENIEDARELMRITQGKCKVQYIWAEG